MFTVDFYKGKSFRDWKIYFSLYKSVKNIVKDICRMKFIKRIWACYIGTLLISFIYGLSEASERTWIPGYFQVRNDISKFNCQETKIVFGIILETFSKVEITSA